MFHSKENNLDNCGCVYKNGTSEKHGKIVYTPRTLVSECFAHKKQRLNKIRIKQELKIFPDADSKNIYKMLDRMIDELVGVGFDTVYITDKMKLVVKKYAIRISNSYKQ